MVQKSKILFYLLASKQTTQGASTIYCRLVLNNQRKQFSTGLSVSTKEWDKIKQQAKVRAYNHENLYSKKGAEKFKVFIGFKNLVCCNMCVSSDGYKAELKAMSCSELFNSVVKLFQEYNIGKHLSYMKSYKDNYMTERQFAQFLGKSRLFQYLPMAQKKQLPSMLMTDTQIGLMAKAYYNDENFSLPRNQTCISMWNVYNLLTGANKSSYIDNFLDRAMNATQLTEGLNKALQGENEYSWFIE